MGPILGNKSVNANSKRCEFHSPEDAVDTTTKTVGLIGNSYGLAGNKELRGKGHSIQILDSWERGGSKDITKMSFIDPPEKFPDPYDTD